jgi:RimJ/RimL family protein N-acetyltransferase
MSKKAESSELTLHPFCREDFTRLISWVPSEAAHVEWCAGFFTYPLNDTQLDRYLESSKHPYARNIFTARTTTAGDAVGHVEISQIWPYLSSRLSRVLIAPEYRHRGIGSAMVAQAVSFSFREHRVNRVDLGVSASNMNAIGCYKKLAFQHVGTWPKAIALRSQTIDVYWMTLTRGGWIDCG